MQQQNQQNQQPTQRSQRSQRTQRSQRSQRTHVPLADSTTAAKTSRTRLGELLVNEKAASGKTGPTPTWYAGAIRRYAEWLQGQGEDATLEHFTLDLVRQYIVDLQQQQARASHPLMPTEDRPLSDRTINSYVRALRAFSTWLAQEGYISDPVLARLKAPKMTSKTQIILCLEEITAIVTSLNPRTEIRARSGHFPPVARYWRACW